MRFIVSRRWRASSLRHVNERRREENEFADRPHDRRIGFERRRRHRGRSENLFRARRLWRGVVTALTAQNTKGVFGVHDVPADFIAAQIDAVFSDLDIGAVKIGMLG